MKKELASLELYYLIKEFQQFIGSKVDQIYQKDKNEFTFQMHKTNFGKFMIKVNLPSLIYITKYKGQQPSVPPGFCTFLRKRLKNARLKEIQQLDFERIIQFTFTTKEDEYFLIVELFAEGNVILCNKEMKIISLILAQKWKERTLRGGVDYVYPKRNIKLNDKDFILNTIEKSEKSSIVKSLAIELGLGGTYAEEICFLAHIDKNKKELNKDEKELLFQKIQEILNKEIKGIVTEKDIHPFELKTKKTIKEFETYSEALDEILTQNKINDENKIITSKKDKETNKINNMINNQEKRIVELEKEIEENKKKSEMIYLNYEKINNLLKEAKEKKGNIKHPLIKKVDNKIITIELK